MRSILENPYWIEWPKPSKNGLDDEIAARLWVDVWVKELAISSSPSFTRNPNVDRTV